MEFESTFDYAKYKSQRLMGLSIHSDEHFMKQAYQQALIAREEGEVPVGAVVVCQNRVIAKAYNQTEKLTDVTAHAEMIALTAAFEYLGAKYLPDCTLFVTLEPCVMCAGASNWAQIARLVYGASDNRRGYNQAAGNLLHPKTKIESGLMQKECKKLLDDFFEELRE